MSYAIGPFGFVRWLGDPPQLVQQHLRLFAKPGQDGISAQAVGAFGDVFAAELHAVFADQVDAATAEDGYRFLVGAAPQIVTYNALNYFTTYSHRYLVLNVGAIDCRRHPLLTGPGYAFVGGWVLRSRWQLQPLV